MINKILGDIAKSGRWDLAMLWERFLEVWMEEGKKERRKVGRKEWNGEDT